MSNLVDTVIGHSTDRVVFGTSVIAALCYFVPLLIAFRADLPAWIAALGKPFSTDPPEFDTKSASATGLTAVTAVLGSILGTKLLPPRLRLRPSQPSICRAQVFMHTLASFSSRYWAWRCCSTTGLVVG